MLNITTATADVVMAQTADVLATQAATRPLAGFGAGAFMCDGAPAASQVSEMAAVLALPRVKPASGASGIGASGTGGAKAGVAGAGWTARLIDRSELSIARMNNIQADNHNFIQMARQYPVVPGGVGPHPAREPEPV
jgi:hypothetical protein